MSKMRPTKIRRMMPSKNETSEMPLLTTTEMSSASISSSGEGESDHKLVSASTPLEPRKSIVNMDSAQTSRKLSGRKGIPTVATEGALLDGFKLQVRELIRGVTPRYAAIETQMEGLLNKIRTSMTTAKPLGPLSVAQATQKPFQPHQVVVPFPEPRPSLDVNYKFVFLEPVAIELQGAFSQRTAIVDEHKLNIDLAVQMPEAIFDRKDYQDYRFFHKRAFYLARLADSILDGIDSAAELRFELHQDNPLLPIITIEPSTGRRDDLVQSHYNIRIFPHVQASVFPAERLRPASCCIRSMKPSSTQFYNASMALNTAVMSYRSLTDQVATSFSGFHDACVLGHVWLKQRGLHSALTLGGFGPEEWTMLLVVVLNEARCGRQAALLPASDGIQLFKIILQYLGLRDLILNPLSLGSGQQAPVSVDSIPMLFSRDLNLNILYKMTSWSYSQLKTDAKATLSQLNKDDADKFDLCFIYKAASPFLAYDYVLTISDSCLTHREDTEITDEPIFLQNARALYEVLQNGLSDRVISLKLQLPALQPLNLRAEQLAAHSNNIIVCMTINPLAVMRKVDRGPSAEESESAAKFRTFWGERVELRRFNDGSICETVAWKGHNSRTLLLEIITYLLQVHFHTTPKSDLLIKGNALQGVMDGAEPTLAPFDHIVASYESLDSSIRSINDLPLQIRQIKPASAALCFTAPHIPSKSTNTPQTPIDVVVQFEGSARWPDDLTAIQMTKIAFLLKMKDSLRLTSSAASTRVGLENEHSDILNKTLLEVEDAAGLTFNVRIHHDREQTLLERQLKDRSSNPKARQAAAIALSSYKRTFERKPTHVGAVQVLARRHPAFSPTARLLKTWFSAHLLQSHITQEFIDIVAARPFVQPYPWSAPKTPMTGFLRALLFLSKWDWQHAPLVVDFSGDMSRETFQMIVTRFEAWRKVDPEMNRVVMFAATNFDPDGTTWTEHKPSKVIAGRMTSLAKAAIAIVMRDGLDLDTERLFKASLKDFDFVLYLSAKPTEMSGGRRPVNRRRKSIDQYGSSQQDITLAFLQTLQTVYAEAALFFTKPGDEIAIAGLWTPNANSRLWKPSLPYSSRPSVSLADDQTEATLNKPAMLAEMARLGGDLVASITSRG